MSTPSFDRRIAMNWMLALGAFATVAWGLDYFLTHQIVEKGESFEAAKVWRLTQQYPGETPIFGASKAQSNYIPELLEIKAFNYGMASASFEVVDVLLQIELQKQDAKAPIIIDMHHQSFRGIGDVSKFVPFAHWPEVRDLLQRDGSMRLRYLVPGLRYFGHVDFYLKDYLNEQTHVTRKTVNGYTHILNPIPWDHDAFNAAVKKRLKSGTRFWSDPGQEERLIRHLHSARHRQFILVFSPLHDSWFANFKGKDAFNKYLAKLDSIENVAVLDMTRLPLPDEYFRDTGHLNEQGATEFSQRLRVAIQRILNDGGSRRHEYEIAARESDD